MSTAAVAGATNDATTSSMEQQQQQQQQSSTNTTGPEQQQQQQQHPQSNPREFGFARDHHHHHHGSSSNNSGSGAALASQPQVQPTTAHKHPPAAPTLVQVTLPQELRRVLEDVAKGSAATITSTKLPWMEQPVVEYAVPRHIPRKRPPLFPPKSSGRSSNKRPRPFAPGSRGFGASQVAAAAASTTTTTTTVIAAPLDPVLQPPPHRRFVQQQQQQQPPHDTASRRFLPPTGWASGSEQEPDEYDYNSESTSVTSVSELSFKSEQRASSLSIAAATLGGHPSPSPALQHSSSTSQQPQQQQQQPSYKSLSEVVRDGVGHVLEHFYRHRGGYHLSPTELRHLRVIAETKGAPSYRDAQQQEIGPHPHPPPPLPPSAISTRDIISDFQAKHSVEERDKIALETFQRRKERIVALVGGFPHAPGRRSGDAPPFTLQRIAEVLVDPDRYYSQTHKLCNSLEKLLLVSTSVGDFGGSFGGDTASVRSYLEDKEASREMRRQSQRRLLRKGSSGTPTSFVNKTGEPGAVAAASPAESSKEEAATQQQRLLFPGREDMATSAAALAAMEDDTYMDAEEPEEILDAAARASLRAKFDHVGLDRQSLALPERCLSPEKRQHTGSPPPPSMVPNVPAIPLPGVHGVPILRPHGSPSSPKAQQAISQSLSQLPAPKLPCTGGLQHPQAQLQANHAAAVAGVSPFHLIASSSSSGTAAATDGGANTGADRNKETDGPSSSLDASAAAQSDGSSDQQPPSADASLPAAAAVADTAETPTHAGDR